MLTREQMKANDKLHLAMYTLNQGLQEQTTLPFAEENRLKNTLAQLEQDLTNLPLMKKDLENRIIKLKERIRECNYQKYIQEWIKHFPDIAPHPYASNKWEDNVQTMEQIGLKE